MLCSTKLWVVSEAMIQAFWAMYYHSISTDRDPQHNCCPKGLASWCFYLQVIALGKDLLYHIDDYDSSCLIPLQLAQHVKPIFDRLCALSLLEKCVLGVTQNHNENFNSVLGNLFSKTNFCCGVSVKLAVNLAFLTFNDGVSPLTNIMREFGIQLRPLGLCSLASKDSITY